MQRLPLSVQNAYSDLLDRLQDDAVLEIGGKPVQRTIRGRRYWYGRNYVGNEERERYLGPDTPELRARIERLQAEMSGLRAREQRRRPLVQMLRVRGVPPIDATTGKVVQALARAGVFRLRGVLVGTQAFRLYPLILGVAIPEAHHATEDIDLAQFHEISVALDDKADPKVREALAQVGELTPRASLYPAQPTGYRVADALVEILTPNRGPDRDEPIELPALGVYARPLRFLDFLLAEAIPAAVPYRYGVLVNVPPPARYAVHKLIIATRRAQDGSGQGAQGCRTGDGAHPRARRRPAGRAGARLSGSRQPRRTMAPRADPRDEPHDGRREANARSSPGRVGGRRLRLTPRPGRFSQRSRFRCPCLPRSGQCGLGSENGLAMKLATW